MWCFAVRVIRAVNLCRIDIVNIEMWWFCILTIYGISVADASCGRCGALHLELINPSFAGYKVQWCSNETLAVDWKLSVYDLNKTSDQCTQKLVNPRIRRTLHSQIEESNVTIDQNGCEQMCWTVELDLLYAGCYKFVNLLTKENKKLTPCQNVMYLKNTKTIQDFLRTQPVFDVESEGDNITVKWYFGHIPIKDYKIGVLEVKDDQGKASYTPNRCDRVDMSYVWCSFGPLDEALYRIHFEHLAPWTNGNLRRLSFYSYDYKHERHNATATHEQDGGGRGWWGGAAGGGAAVVGAAVVAVILRKQDIKRWRKKVWSAWSPRTITPSLPTSPPSVLVVCCWADRALGSAVGTALAQRGATVYELQGARERAVAAQSPIQWINALLDRCVVVFIDSPALSEILKDADLNNDAAPLLPPRPTDALVRAAAGRARADAGRAAVYRKYYVASVNGANSMPSVCPLTRYDLPSALRPLVDTILPIIATDNKESVTIETQTLDTGPQTKNIA